MSEMEFQFVFVLPKLIQEPVTTAFHTNLSSSRSESRLLPDSVFFIETKAVDNLGRCLSIYSPRAVVACCEVAVAEASTAAYLSQLQDGRPVSVWRWFLRLKHQQMLQLFDKRGTIRFCHTKLKVQQRTCHH